MRRADPRGVEGGGGRGESHGLVPAAWHLRCNLLHLAERVRQLEIRRCTRLRQQGKIGGSRPSWHTKGARPSGAEGCTDKKRLRPAVIGPEDSLLQRSTLWTNRDRSARFLGDAGEDRDHLRRQRPRDLTEERRRWGRRLLYLILRPEGFKANHKGVERLYREEGSSLRRRWRCKTLESFAPGTCTAGAGVPDLFARRDKL